MTPDPHKPARSDHPPAVKPRCPSVHYWSNVPCMREAGHAGYCRSRARLEADGLIARAVWMSVRGVFKSHHAYEFTNATNARPRR